MIDLYCELVNEFGFSKDIFNSRTNHGNVITLHLIIGGLMHQPCNPTFIDARDAILQADKNYFDGKYNCNIWKAFAKRGMGSNVSINSTDLQNDFEIPLLCQSAEYNSV